MLLQHRPRRQWRSLDRAEHSVVDGNPVIGRDALGEQVRIDRGGPENVLAHRNHLGLLSEDIDPATGVLWGNFPQTYSQVGLIFAAMRLSRSWEEGMWRAS